MARTRRLLCRTESRRPVDSILPADCRTSAFVRTAADCEARRPAPHAAALPAWPADGGSLHLRVAARAPAANLAAAVASADSDSVRRQRARAPALLSLLLNCRARRAQGWWPVAVARAFEHGDRCLITVRAPAAAPLSCQYAVARTRIVDRLALVVSVRTRRGAARAPQD